MEREMTMGAGERASTTPSGCHTKEEASSLGNGPGGLALKGRSAFSMERRTGTGRRVHKSKGMEMCECFLGTSVVLEKQQMRLARQLHPRL